MKILYVVAQENFRDEELFIPLEIFKNEGIHVDIASVRKGPVKGSKGGQAEANFSLADVSMIHYHAIVIAGGPGALSLDGNPELNRLFSEAVKHDRLICAICIAPIILAHSGVLNDHSATVWDNNGEQVKIFREHGIIYLEDDVVVDRLVITANGPHAAEEFARKIIEEL